VLSDDPYGFADAMVSPTARPVSDVLVIGDGLIGLSTALALGRAGVRTVVIGKRRTGAASSAAAGLLVPSIGTLPSAVQSFFAASLAAYPAFLASLADVDPALRLIEGIFERSEDGGDRMHPHDAAVDNVRLLAAVAAAVGATPIIARVEDAVSSVDIGTGSARVITASGARYSAARVILAAGAWAPQLAGLPRPLPVRPLKGQMLALGACPLTHSIMGDDAYLVPRGNETLVGATVEEAGFDTTIDPRAIDALHRAAVALVPALRDAQVTRTWSGIRPATPDMLPVLGPEPLAPTLIYACGHSKNGILLAPATASALADVVQQRPSAHDLTPFRADRWEPI